MSNIPKLQQNNRAQAQTQTADRSGVLKQEQRGIADFNQFLQTTIKQGGELIDSKIYATESSKAEKEILEFMSDAKKEQNKAQYLKQNNGSLVGFHQYQAKKNMDFMEKSVSKFSHPKVRKELENKLSFQAQKSLITDLNDENRVTQALVQEREEIKNQTLAVEIGGMKSRDNNEQYQIAVTQRLSDIQKGVTDGTLDAKYAVKLRADVLDSAATLRARALVEGGDSLAALETVETNRFGTLSAKVAARNYVMSKHLDGTEKQFKQLKEQAAMKRLQDQLITSEIDEKLTAIQLGEGTDLDKLQASKKLRAEYGAQLNSKQFNKFVNASKVSATNYINTAVKEVNSLNMDEFNSKMFKAAEDRLRGLSLNPDVDPIARQMATKTLKDLKKKKARHEKLMRSEATREFAKDPRTERTHDTITRELNTNPKYKDLPVDGQVEIYNLFKESKYRNAIGLATKKLKGVNHQLVNSKFEVPAREALDMYQKDPVKFEKVIKARIKKGHKLYDGLWSNRPASQNDLDKMYRSFIQDFAEYKNKFEKIDLEEERILKKYEGFVENAN